MRKLLLALAAPALLVACSADTQEHSESHKTEHDAPKQEAKAHHEPHVLSLESHADFETTLAQLQAAITARGLKTFIVIDHAAGATSVDQPLRPTTLIIFGNPTVGAPVMQAEQIMGIELPLKMLVTQGEEGAVTLTWRDMGHTFHEYGISEHPAAEKMSGALKAIAEEASR